MTTRPARDVRRRPLSPRRRSILKAAAGGILAAPFFAARGYSQEQLRADIGTMLIVGFSGRANATALADQMRAGLAGGVLFLRHNVGTRAEVTELTSLFKQANPNAFIAIDHEGGLVQRLTEAHGVQRLPAAHEVPSMLDPQGAQALYAAAGRQLFELGFNFNFAPVVDLHMDGNPVIGDLGRAFSSDPDVVAAYATACVAGYREASLFTSLKHFPGHGRSQGDTHDAPVDITNTWSVAETDPFKDMIRSGDVDSVMVGHLTHRQLYVTDRPASLNSRAINTHLRRALQYRGVVIADDLDMAAIRSIVSLEEAVISTIEAGTDLLLLSNSLEQDIDLPARVADWVMAAVADGRLSAERIALSAERIRLLKSSRPAVSSAAPAPAPAPAPIAPVPQRRPARPGD